VQGTGSCHRAFGQTQFNAALDQSIGGKIQIDTNGYRLADQAATTIGDCDWHLIGGNAMYVTLLSEPKPVNFSAVKRLEDVTSIRPSRYAAGAHLFYEGDPADYVYEIQSGAVRLTRVLETGCRQVIAFGLPGDIVGFPDGGLHHTECDALTPVVVIAHRRTALEAGEGDPKTHQRLFHAALREISTMQDHLMMLARKSALEKVASFLIALSQRIGRCNGTVTAVDLPMSRTDIADFLGLAIETVSRTFSQLRQLGAIVLETPQTILVRDIGALVKASQAVGH